MSLDLVKYGPALKEYYSDTAVENMVYADYPLFAMLEKSEKFYGKSMPIPIIIGNPQGRSRTFSKAKANKGSSVLRDFDLTRVRDYSLASIDNETAEASENDEGAFLKALTVEIDGAYQSAAISLASALFRDQSGYRGQVGALGVDTITLTEPDDVVNYEIGMVLTLAAAKSTGVEKNAGGTVEIEKVDRDTGLLTFVAGQLAANIAAAGVNDYIFVEGDRNLAEAGLESWLPSIAPVAGDNFFGVDRSVDPTRLAGIRVDGTALPIEEALIKGAARVNREGGRANVCWVNYTVFEDLEKALGAKVQYMVSQAFGRADIGFEGIAIKSNKGTINVIADPFCPASVAYMLTMKTWKLYSLKKAIRILDLDGNKTLRESDADAVELRIGGYRNLGCNAPGWNATIKLA